MTTETKKALLTLKDAMEEDYLKAIKANDEKVIKLLDNTREALSKISPIF